MLFDKISFKRKSERLHNLRKYLLLAPAMVPLLACNAPSFSKPNEVYINGRIDADMVGKLKNAPTSLKTIKITSQGGDTIAAIAIGKIIHAKKLDVEVVDICTSACAQWIMPAAKSLKIDDGALVAGHFSATWTTDILLGSGDKTAAQSYKQAAALEKEYYSDLGVDLRLLTYPFYGKLPRCYAKGTEKSGGFAVIVSQYQGVVLTKESYEQLTGQQVSGNWAQSEGAILAKMKSAKDQLQGFSVSKEHYPDVRDFQPPALPLCSDEELKRANLWDIFGS